ncbi:MAG: hypothetical protein PHD21_07395 [Flavobacteriales bacterium]|nr:hypothetical protein [Flavobacteriales bacterium]
MKVKYTIDGKDFALYGITVTSSQGLLGGLKPKDPLAMEWTDENGTEVDDDAPVFFQSRAITLNCIMTAASAEELITASRAFYALFFTKRLHTLEVSVGDNKLSYTVYLSDKIDIDKKWRQGHMTASFALKMTEPEPINQ